MGVYTDRFICWPKFAALLCPVRRSRTHHLDTRYKRSRGRQVARPRYLVGHLLGLHSEDEMRAPRKPTRARLSRAMPGHRAGRLRRRLRVGPPRSRCSSRLGTRCHRLGSDPAARLGASKKGTVPRSSSSNSLRYSPHFRRSCPALGQDLRLQDRCLARPSARAALPHESRTHRHWPPWRSCREGERLLSALANRAPALSRLRRDSLWSALA
jgi:hypothetical protein